MNLCNSNEKQSAASSSKNVKNLNFESHKMFQKPCLSFSKGPLESKEKNGFKVLNPDIWYQRNLDVLGIQKMLA